MLVVSINLMHNNCPEPQKRFTSLKDAWWHVKTTINEPRSWYLQQMEGDEMVDNINCFVLIENLKNENDVPQLISDVKL